MSFYIAGLLVLELSLQYLLGCQNKNHSDVYGIGLFHFQYIHGLAAHGVHYLHQPGPTLQDTGFFLIPVGITFWIAVWFHNL